MKKPQNVRNFWLEAEKYAGSEKEGEMVSMGPRSKEGELKITVYIRNNGEVEEACTLLCRCSKDNHLTVKAITPELDEFITLAHTVR